MKLIKKQPHKGSCAVVAYANLFKLMGKKMTYKKAIKRMGGVPDGNKGIKIKKLALTLAKDFNVYVLKLTHKEVVSLSKTNDIAVAVCYAWDNDGAHVAAIDRKGKCINTNKRRRVTPKRWKETKKVWATGPLTIVITEKE